MQYQEIKDRYLEIANSRAFLNTKTNTGMFLSLVGAKGNDRRFQAQLINRVDLRIHTLLVQPSRSGKGAAMGVASEFAKRLRLSYTEEMGITDAAMVGTIDSKIEQRNREKGYGPDDPDYVDPIILGALGLYKVITFPEAKPMFKTGAYTENINEIFQGVMDSPSFVSRRLANNVPIKYPTDTTIIGTTYFLEEFDEILLKQGVFQRMMIMVDPFGIDKRMKLNDAMIDPPEQLLDYDTVLPALGELTDVINDKMSSFERGFVFDKSEGGKLALKKLNHKRMKEIDAQFIGRDREIMLPYTTALLNTHHKLAAVAAILNGSDLITEQEVSETRIDIEKSFSCVVNDIISRVSGVKPQKIQKIIRGLLQQTPEGLNISEIKDKLDVGFHINKRQTGQVLRTMFENKEIIKMKRGNLVKINR